MHGIPHRLGGYIRRELRRSAIWLCPNEARNPPSLGRLADPARRLCELMVRLQIRPIRNLQRPAFFNLLADCRSSNLGDHCRCHAWAGLSFPQEQVVDALESACTYCRRSEFSFGRTPDAR